MKPLYLFLTVLFCITSLQLANGQIAIGTGTPASSALLDLTATGKGLLFPRMTTEQRDAISSPASGLMIFNTTTRLLEYQTASGSWRAVPAFSKTSNGSATISSVSCNEPGAATGLLASNIQTAKQKIRVTVTNPGTYSFDTKAHGFGFSSSGVFATTGIHDIELQGYITSPNAFYSYGDQRLITFTLNDANACQFTRIHNNSSNGRAVFGNMQCVDTGLVRLPIGVPVSGLTKTVTVDVGVQTGNYNLLATAGGLTFTASGTVTTPNTAVNIVLTASGTPTIAGSNTFTVNTVGGCSFDIYVYQPSTNGTGIVSGYTTKREIGNLILGEANASTNNEHVLTATVTQAGSYDLKATNNGVTFSATGTFPTTGDVWVTMKPEGAALVTGTHTYTLNTTPNHSFSRKTYLPQTNDGIARCDGAYATSVKEVVYDGKTYMDRNLGASRAATSLTDKQAYGCLYQWGRGNDGHAGVNWNSNTALYGTTTTLSTVDTPTNYLFITVANATSNLPWFTGDRPFLWVTAPNADPGVNNPCPPGYIVSKGTEYLTFSNSADAFNSTLKYPAAGYRSQATANGGTIYQNGVESHIWDFFSTYTYLGFPMQIRSASSSQSLYQPASKGGSVRCEKSNL